MFDGVVNKWLEKSLNVDLISGENTIEIEPSWGWMDIDYIAVPADIITNIENETNIKNKFYLSQNYPNPFNPNTTIEYSIPINSSISNSQRNENNKVSLKIYDILGSEVASLVNTNQTPGNYKIVFDANNFSSGIYFYTLKVGSLIQSRKMILLK
jgi:hypothetical protein